MIDKRVRSAADALTDVADGATVMIGGFGSVGHPNALIDGLIERGARDLVVIANNAGAGREGLSKLLQLRRVRRMICSFPKAADSTAFIDLYKEKLIELEVVPQGTLAERIRAAGAGVPAFYTPTSVGTLLAEGKPVATFNGRQCVLELALSADVALIEAWKGDRWGNLTYRASGRNFNPIMATAAKLTIAQAHQIVELGELDPESIVTPGIFVHRLVHAPSEFA